MDHLASQNEAPVIGHPGSKLYECWSLRASKEIIEAADSYAARKAFAAKHSLQVSECIARRLRS